MAFGIWLPTTMGKFALKSISILALSEKPHLEWALLDQEEVGASQWRLVRVLL